MSSQYLLAKMALVYTPEAEDGDIEQGLTEGENGDNDLTDTFASRRVLLGCLLTRLQNSTCPHFGYASAQNVSLPFPLSRSNWT